MKAQAQLLRMKLFNRFNKFSPADLARQIEEETGIPTDRIQVWHVINGTMKMRHIREQIAQMLGEPVDQLFPEKYLKFGVGRKKKAA